MISKNKVNILLDRIVLKKVSSQSLLNMISKYCLYNYIPSYIDSSELSYSDLIPISYSSGLERIFKIEVAHNKLLESVEIFIFNYDNGRFILRDTLSYSDKILILRKLK